MEDMERLAIAQAFYNAVGDMVKTKDPDNIRGRVDALMSGYYETTGAKSYDVRVFGRKVGTYSFTVSKPTESKETVELQVENSDELLGWAIANGCVSIDMDKVRAKFERDGELPDGCEAVKVVVPGTDGGDILRSTLKVNAPEVMRVLGPQLEPVATMLLEGGFDA